ncbi:hypothetical protein WA158_002390 [Blastocystis sp. Blastoise]
MECPIGNTTVLKEWLLKKMDFRMIWKRRFFILSGDQLIYYRDIADSGPRNIFYLNESYKIVDYGSQDNIHQFSLYQGSQRLLWLATEDTKAKQWIKAIQNQISYHICTSSQKHLNKEFRPSISISENDSPLVEPVVSQSVHIPSSCLYNTMCGSFSNNLELKEITDGCLFYTLPKTDMHHSYSVCNTCVNCRIDYLVAILMDYQYIKRLWSPCFFSGNKVEVISPSIDIIHLIYKPIVALTFPVKIQSSYRDACLLRYTKTIDDTYYIIMSSITHPQCPVNPHYQRAEFCMGYKIQPVEGDKVSVTLFLNMRPCGFIQYFPGIVDIYTKQMLSSLPGLTCFLSQLPSFHIYALIETLKGKREVEEEVKDVDIIRETQEELAVSSYISNSIPHSFEAGNSEGYWEECPDVIWRVRGPTYIETREKQESLPGYCQLVAVDIFRSANKIENIASNPNHSVTKASQQHYPLPENGLFFVINLQMTQGSHVSVSCTFSVPQSLQEDGKPLALLKKYINGGKEFRDSRFKMIPRIEEGSFLIKKAVGTTPVLLGKKGTSAYYTGQSPIPYFEVDFDMDSNSVAKNMAKMMFGNSSSMVIDIGFLIQGDSSNELPERMIGSFRLVHVNINEAMQNSVANIIRSSLRRAQRGLYAGSEKLFGNNVSHSQRKTRRCWDPNVKTKKLWSENLNQFVEVRVTMNALRTIEKKGGLDNYILYTDKAKIDSSFGMDLRSKIKEAMKQNGQQAQQRIE